jgi:hypothetical protein
LRQRRLVEQGIQLDREDRPATAAHAVFTELQQVVLNFLINAEQSVRACPPGSRRIIVRTYGDDDLVHLEVEDSGPGVAPENETKLFQPFFTTKPVGEGTGLGLSVSYGIIHSLGGENRLSRRCAWRRAVSFFGAGVGSSASRRQPEDHSMTERLYYTDPLLREFDARVLSCGPAGDHFEAVLDRTGVLSDVRRPAP